jgi:hypothetical protein
MSRADHNPLASSSLPSRSPRRWRSDGRGRTREEEAETRQAGAAPREVKLPRPPRSGEAAELVYYGVYECEFNQNVNILASTTHHFYFDVKHGKTTWLMKPCSRPRGPCASRT